MHITTKFFVALLVMLPTIVMGVVHGRLTDRWGIQPDRVEGGIRLQKIPEKFGNWQRVKEEDLGKSVENILQCDGYINHVYKNDAGDMISIVVLLGPVGPIAVHTPEICYSSRDYSITSERTKWSPANKSDEFWDLRLRGNKADGSNMRVLYGWTNAQSFQADSQPRFKYGGSRYLYKIQLAGPEIKTTNGEIDPFDDFLTAFLPVLRKQMIQTP